MGRRDLALTRAPRRLGGAVAAVLCTAGLVAGSSLPAQGAPDPGSQKRTVDRKIDKLEDHLDDTSAALSQAYENLKATKAKLPAAQEVLEKAQQAAQAAEQARAAAVQELEVAQANEAKAEDELEQATDEVAAGRVRIAQFAAQIYQEQGFGQLDVALSSTEPQQFADRIAMVDTVLDVQNRTMDRLTTEQANLTAIEDHLSALRADSVRKKKAAEAAYAKAEDARKQADKAKADLEALAASQRQQAQSYEDQLAADKKQLESMKSEQQRLQKILEQRAAEARRRAAAAAKRKAAADAARRKKAGQSSSGSSGSSSGGGSSGGGSSGGGGGSSSGGVLARPVNSGWVSSEYGMRYHPLYKYWKLHSGRDYAANCGTPVYAAASGTVIMAGYGGGYGNRVVIDHGLKGGSGLASTYNHLSSISVGGGWVSKGTRIGYVGTTGTSTGCHLHFETLVNGGFSDPRRWLSTLG
ncbi:peptidoglycan DD-metalloendopeptidase family protein [Phycicoccus sp. CSK15P-2]|uniref:M23 family metallopeptidase n=1 Tax=Phycicoccus sp. CSK15P-2 TaxID=2807627 RepID=UPI00194FB503|nr:M23 family metallopeptidase [Phycicoccus sp. CSK15P-2]MBM6404357.1 peptidoglycan DD-metalloendopeptidase family protein [Phycicoccus sp. CSK15P-2]